MSADTHHGPKFLQHHFDTPVQQFEASKLGMWLFLAQEVLFFSAMFVAYFVYRSWYPEAFSAGSALLDKEMGFINTLVLLFSSLTAAMAVRSAQSDDSVRFGGQKWTGRFLLITILCAFGFLIIKYFEYTHKFHVGYLPAGLFSPSEFPVGIESVPYATGSFFGIYFMMTGLHGVHVTIGIFILAWLWLKNHRGEFTPQYFTHVDLAALYWHLVDLVWIFLFPLLYLID